MNQSRTRIIESPCVPRNPLEFYFYFEKEMGISLPFLKFGETIEDVTVLNFLPLFLKGRSWVTPFCMDETSTITQLNLQMPPCSTTLDQKLWGMFLCFVVILCIITASHTRVEVALGITSVTQHPNLIA